MQVKEWLRESLECESFEMDRLYNSQTGLNFLLVWNIFEVELFNKFCTKEGLRNVAVKLSHNSSIGDLQKYIEYFHNRYQNDKAKYRSLKHGEYNAATPDYVVANTLDNSSLEEKIHFLLFVLLRYRNNMFHGNKGLTNWLQYDVQIRLCTEAMCLLVDIYKEVD